MRSLRFIAVTLSVASLLACGAGESADDDGDALTSLTAKERKLAFEGVVYVAPGTATDVIVARALQQAKSAFGALRTSGMMAQQREMQALDRNMLKTREVRVVDARDPASAGEPMLEVRYTYTDEVLVESKLGDRTSYALALLHPDWESALERPTRECVENEREARHSSRDGFLWYYFNPTLPSCRRAIDTEQKAVDRDKVRLATAATAAAASAPAAADATPAGPTTAPTARIPKSQTTRRYYPITIALEAMETSRGATYPEYDQLFRGGVQSGKLVIGVLAGRLEHSFTEASKDGGYWEWLSTLDTLFGVHPEFKMTGIEPAEDLSKLTVGTKTYESLALADYMGWTLYDRYPAGVTTSQKRAFQVAAAKKLDKHYLTFEKRVKVAFDGGAPKPLTIELRTYFGVETELDIYKRFMKTSDVFVYNGHSFLGNGPLDPSNFQSSDFPSSYQLWFIDGCISYNYYNNDYFPLKGGSKKLDLIVNGLEAPADYGGEAEAKLLARLISGKQPSYKQLLQSARKTDAFRVVEGEVDNAFSPTRTKIVFSAP